MNTNNSVFESLTPTAYIVVSLGDISNYIEKKFSSFLLPPEPGIYKWSEKTPVMRNGQLYFIRSVKDNSRFLQFTSFDNVLDGDYITDADGKVVVTDNELRNRETFLSNKPLTVTVGFDIAKLAIEYYVSAKNQYTRDSYGISSRANRYFKNDSPVDVFDCIINDEVMGQLFMQIDSFVGRDVNHVYFFRQCSLFDLLIEKTIDWRAFQWEEMMREKNCNDHHL